ncbi:MAG: LysR family transcriptional regulator [Lachnospiraceae bacterium]|nr:LysR family transcriptional regulator [Lachnospiraceae bacterium]MDD3616712.1 LysR family transcriptional regulator [Lachnospiraceae bacterium]
MFELNQLEQLLAIANAGTLSKAAEQLHLSQPALSRSMQRLEEELQVTLFERQKNKITFNANGDLALEHAKTIINNAETMISALQAFERSQHTFSIGSCAPAPLWRITPVISRQYTDMTIQSDIKSQDALISGLYNDIYQVIITTHPLNDPDVCSYKYLEEHLYVALPPAHPLSTRKKLSLADINGQTMLLLSRIGFWYDICKEKMPDSYFIVQDEVEALNELRKSSAIPTFATNLTAQGRTADANRILIPLTDSEVNVTFFCCIKKSNNHRLSKFIASIQ